MPKKKTQKQAESVKDTEGKITANMTTDERKEMAPREEATADAEASMPAVLDEEDSAEIPEAVVDTNLIDEAVEFINEKYHENAYKMAIEIGTYVLKEFFCDDIALAASRTLENRQASEHYAKMRS